MGHMKKLIAALLTLTVAFSPCAATVQAAPKVPKSHTVYVEPKGMWSMNGSDSVAGPGHSIYITGLSDRWDVTDIKSSNTKVIPADMAVDFDSYLWFYTNNIGKATISFKIKGKPYRIKVTAKKYVNPVSSLSITGVKSKGKTELAGLTNKKSYVSGLKTSRPKAAPTVRLSAKKGWKIKEIHLFTSGDDGHVSKKYKKPVSSVTLKMKKKEYVNSITVTFINTKDKGTRVITYDITK